MKTWIRRIIFCAMALIAAGFLLYKPRPRTAAPPRGVVVVRYWEKWVGNEAAQMRQIVDDFNRTVGREKKIHVDYLSMTDVGTKTLIATAAGVPPDVAGLWDQQVSQYAAIGAAEPLDELAAARGITADTFLPVYWEGCRYNGKLYALVSTPATIALHYNKQVFRECAAELRAAGLDPDHAPQTLDELDRYAAIIDKRDPRTGRLQRAGYIPLQSWYVPFTTYWFGGQIFDNATQQFQLTSPQFLAGFRWIEGYSKRLSHAAIQDFTSSHPVDNFDSPQNPFLTNTLIMQQQGPWQANYIKNLKPSMSQVLVPSARERTLPRRTDNYSWAVAPFPSAVPGARDVSCTSFDALLIPVGARHKNEAFEFIAYVNRPDVSEKLNSLHCKNSQFRNVSKKFFDEHPNPYIDVFQRLAASSNTRGIPPVPIWPEVVKELNDAGQAVAIQGADPEVVLRAAQQKLQRQYDEFRKIQERRARL